MKRYKITCTPYENARPFVTYKDTRKEAREFVANYPGHAAKMQGRPVEMVEHHTATARGYWTKNRDGKPTRESYAGKFGAGYIEHYANADRPDPHGSNNYHVIAYVVEV